MAVNAWTPLHEPIFIDIEVGIFCSLLQIPRIPREVSFEEIANSTYEGDIEKAKRAVGLFNAYCARCHTAGYSAGVAYTKEIASGGLGPALRAGRVNIQFKQREDFIDFIIKGSVNGKAYGVNGVGGGKMPGFGAVLPQSDIELIIDYLRGMEPDA